MNILKVAIREFLAALAVFCFLVILLQMPFAERRATMFRSESVLSGPCQACGQSSRLFGRACIADSESASARIHRRFDVALLTQHILLTRRDAAAATASRN
jgi:hypothetical protein